MKFFIIVSITPLFLAVGKRNLEIIKLLLSCKNIDVNMKSIFTFDNTNKIYFKKFYEITNH